MGKALIIFLISCTVPFLANAQQNFSLSEAIQYAIAHHSSAKLNAINIADAEQNMKELRAISKYQHRLLVILLLQQLKVF